MINLENVKSLLGEKSIFSLYLDVDNALPENQAQNPAWQIELKNALRRIDDQQGKDETWRTIRSRVTAYFEMYTPASKGLVVFFAADNEQTYELPVHVDTFAGYGRPLLLPLVWLLDTYHPYLVAMVDQENAHLYTSYLGATAFEDALEIDLDEYDFGEKTFMPSTSAPATGGRTLTQGSNREAFEATIDEHRARFYRDVVEQISTISTKEGIDHVILAGSEQAAHTVYDEMHQEMQRRVVAVVNIPLRTKPSDIFAHIYPIAASHEQERDQEMVEEVLGLAKSGGRGVLGREGVAHSLKMQQVEALVLSWPADPEMEELVRDTLALNGGVRVAEGEAGERLNAEAGGVAARLYYTLG